MKVLHELKHREDEPVEQWYYDPKFLHDLKRREGQLEDQQSSHPELPEVGEAMLWGHKTTITLVTPQY